MNNLGASRISDEVILVARILLVVLFLIFGWSKIVNYGGTVGYMEHSGLPVPMLAALVAILFEFIFAIAIVAGAWTRPLALLMAVYTLATGFIGHHYWTMTGMEQYANEINFYKNVSIIGGFLLLYVTGAGKYSVDARRAGSPGRDRLATGAVR